MAASDHKKDYSKLPPHGNPAYKLPPTEELLDIRKQLVDFQTEILDAKNPYQLNSSDRANFIITMNTVLEIVLDKLIMKDEHRVNYVLFPYPWEEKAPIHLENGYQAQGNDRNRALLQNIVLSFLAALNRTRAANPNAVRTFCSKLNGYCIDGRLYLSGAIEYSETLTSSFTQLMNEICSAIPGDKDNFFHTIISMMRLHWGTSFVADKGDAGFYKQPGNIDQHTLPEIEKFLLRSSQIIDNRFLDEYSTLPPDRMIIFFDLLLKMKENKFIAELKLTPAEQQKFDDMVCPAKSGQPSLLSAALEKKEHAPQVEILLKKVSPEALMRLCENAELFSQLLTQLGFEKTRDLLNEQFKLKKPPTDVNQVLAEMKPSDEYVLKLSGHLIPLNLPGVSDKFKIRIVPSLQKDVKDGLAKPEPFFDMLKYLPDNLLQEFIDPQLVAFFRENQDKLAKFLEEAFSLCDSNKLPFIFNEVFKNHLQQIITKIIRNDPSFLNHPAVGDLGYTHICNIINYLPDNAIISFVNNGLKKIHNMDVIAFMKRAVNEINPEKFIILYQNLNQKDELTRIYTENIKYNVIRRPENYALYIDAKTFGSIAGISRAEEFIEYIKKLANCKQLPPTYVKEFIISALPAFLSHIQMSYRQNNLAEFLFLAQKHLQEPSDKKAVGDEKADSYVNPLLVDSLIQREYLLLNAIEYIITLPDLTLFFDAIVKNIKEIKMEHFKIILLKVPLEKLKKFFNSHDYYPNVDAEVFTIYVRRMLAEEGSVQPIPIIRYHLEAVTQDIQNRAKALSPDGKSFNEMNALVKVTLDDMVPMLTSDRDLNDKMFQWIERLPLVPAMEEWLKTILPKITAWYNLENFIKFSAAELSQDKFCFLLQSYVKDTGNPGRTVNKWLDESIQRTPTSHEATLAMFFPPEKLVQNCLEHKDQPKEFLRFIKSFEKNKRIDKSYILKFVEIMVLRIFQQRSASLALSEEKEFLDFLEKSHAILSKKPKKSIDEKDEKIDPVRLELFKAISLDANLIKKGAPFIYVLPFNIIKNSIASIVVACVEKGEVATQEFLKKAHITTLLAICNDPLIFFRVASIVKLGPTINFLRERFWEEKPAIPLDTTLAKIEFSPAQMDELVEYIKEKGEYLPFQQHRELVSLLITKELQGQPNWKRITEVLATLPEDPLKEILTTYLNQFTTPDVITDFIKNIGTLLPDSFKILHEKLLEKFTINDLKELYKKIETPNIKSLAFVLTPAELAEQFLHRAKKPEDLLSYMDTLRQFRRLDKDYADRFSYAVMNDPANFKIFFIEASKKLTTDKFLKIKGEIEKSIPPDEKIVWINKFQTINEEKYHPKPENVAMCVTPAELAENCVKHGDQPKVFLHFIQQLETCKEVKKDYISQFTETALAPIFKKLPIKKDFFNPGEIELFLSLSYQTLARENHEEKARNTLVNLIKENKLIDQSIPFIVTLPANDIKNILEKNNHGFQLFLKLLPILYLEKDKTKYRELLKLLFHEDYRAFLPNIPIKNQLKLLTDAFANTKLDDKKEDACLQEIKKNVATITNPDQLAKTVKVMYALIEKPANRADLEGLAKSIRETQGTLFGKNPCLPHLETYLKATVPEKKPDAKLENK